MFSETIPFSLHFYIKWCQTNGEHFWSQRGCYIFLKYQWLITERLKQTLSGLQGAGLSWTQTFVYIVYIDPGLLFPQISESCHLKWDNFTIYEILWSVCNKENNLAKMCFLWVNLYWDIQLMMLRLICTSWSCHCILYLLLTFLLIQHFLASLMLLQPTAVPTLLVAKKKKSNNNKGCIWNQSHFFLFPKTYITIMPPWQKQDILSITFTCLMTLWHLFIAGL